MLVLSGVCIDLCDIERMFYNVGLVPHDRLRRWERVCRRVRAARRVFLQRWLRLHIDNNHELRRCYWNMRPLRVWLLLRREWRPAHRVLLLPWVCINRGGIQLLRHYVFNVPHERLRRGECVRGRIGAAHVLYVQPRVFVDIDHDHGMRWQHRDMHCLRRRPQLRGGQRASGRVQLRRRVCIDIHNVKRLRHDVGIVPYDRLRCGQRVCRRVRAACDVFLQHWLRVHVDNDDELRWSQRHMRRVWVGLLLQWERRPAHRVLLLPWVCVNGDNIQRVCHDVFDLLHERLRGGECVRGRIGAACPMYMQPWVRVHIDHDHRMRW